MFDKIEKICHGFCGLVILVVAALYVWKPVPDTIPLEFIPPPRISDAPPKILTIPRNPEDPNAPKTPVLTPTNITAEKVKVIAKLRAASVRPVSVKDLKMKYLQIPRATFNIIENETNWIPQLKLAKSVLRTNKKDGSKCLQLTKIKDDSLLRSVVGLEDGDTIELINGARLDEIGEDSLAYRNQALKMIKEIGNGGTFSLTITRNSSPQHLTFSLLE